MPFRELETYGQCYNLRAGNLGIMTQLQTENLNEQLKMEET